MGMIAGLFNGDMAATVQPKGKAVKMKRGAFANILANAFGKNKPVALVKKGREVSFANIPFFNTAGEPLVIKTARSNGKMRVQVQKAKSANSLKANTLAKKNIKKELALSCNRGISQPVPNFGNRARKVLTDTHDLRYGILKGEIETPGNKSDVLKKKIKAELDKEESAGMNLAWLSQVNNHLGRLNSAKAGLLGARNDDSNLVIDLNDIPRGNVKLEDPRAPRVKKFNPKAVSLSGGPVGEKFDKTVLNSKLAQKNNKIVSEGVKSEEAKKGVARVHHPSAGMEGIGEIKSFASVAKKNTNKSVSRISFQRKETSIPPSPAEIAAKNRSLLSVLKNKVSSKQSQARRSEQVESLDRQADAMKLQENAKSQTNEKVDALRQKGWRIHTPSNNDDVRQELTQSASMQNNRASRPGRVPEDSKKSLRISKTRKYSVKAAEKQKAMGDVSESQKQEYTSQKATETETAKPIATIVEKENAMTNTSAMKNSSHTNQSNQSQQSTHERIENLNELLKKLDTSAKILKGNGQTTMQVRLKPSTLGTLSVVIKEQNGNYNVKLKAQNRDALHAIEKQMPVIREHLISQGINVENVQVEQSREQSFDQAKQEQDTEKQGNKFAADEKRERKHSSQDEQQERQSRKRRLSTGTNTMDYLAD